MTRYEAIEKALRWIASQENLFFTECTQAEEIIARARAALALPEDCKPFAWFHRETGALRFADLQQMADARKLPQVETPLYTAPAKEDSKVVNAELYEAMRDFGDTHARNMILRFCPPGDTNARYEKHLTIIAKLIRYLELREASGEPMPYKVVRDGDKVRFTDAAPPKDGE